MRSPVILKMKNLSKLQKIMNLLIQLAIFLVTYLFIYQEVFQKTDLSGVMLTIENDMLNPEFQIGLLLVIFLMFVNWSVEAYKWKFLIGKVEEVSFFKALQAVLTGISVSSFIPNRVGEFFGRIFILKTASRIEGILITVVGSMSQLLITILAGSFALLIFIPGYLSNAGFSHGYLYHSLVILVLSLNVLLVAMFFKLSFLNTLKERILRNGLKRLRKFFRIFAFYQNREMAIVMLLSFTRYLVFTTQFYLLLILFDVRIPYLNALVLIPIIYLIMAIIPTIALTELGVRGSVALYVFGLYFGNFLPLTGEIYFGVFAASTLLWLINLGIPALIGTIFVFRLQFFRKKNS
ncbi:MAG: lysylphosphatidylglycerol synthase domain-containing protein [Bacteroidales bacterium]|nr:lysylphosphatidylglycerol synthase domain-containing protein [Bacteroidales bacterium]